MKDGSRGRHSGWRLRFRATSEAAFASHELNARGESGGTKSITMAKQEHLCTKPTDAEPLKPLRRSFAVY
jgi:hypothetical protein